MTDTCRARWHASLRNKIRKILADQVEPEDEVVTVPGADFGLLVPVHHLGVRWRVIDGDAFPMGLLGRAINTVNGTAFCDAPTRTLRFTNSSISRHVDEEGGRRDRVEYAFSFTADGWPGVYQAIDFAEIP